MPGESKTTKDHAVIRRWVEQRGGKPAVVMGTEGGGGILRIHFPGGAEETLENTSWDEFFRIFDERQLAFLYQEETAEGKQSRFCKFVDASG